MVSEVVTHDVLAESLSKTTAVAKTGANAKATVGLAISSLTFRLVRVLVGLILQPIINVLMILISRPPQSSHYLCLPF